MAGKAISGEGLSANLAGMTKSQLYEIMSQMKALIEQNKQQARDILIQNPPLTKALFQAQIMLGMVHSPQVIPNIQAVASQQPQPSSPPSQQSNIQAVPEQVSLPDQTGASQAQPPIRQQQQTLPTSSMSSAPAPPVNLQSHPLPTHYLQMPQQSKVQLNPQETAMSIPQSSQLPNVLSLNQPQMPVTSQLQQPLQTTGFPNLPLQPRMPSVPTFHNQYGQQVGPNASFQFSGGPQHPSQPIFHSGNKPQANIGLSFPQGHPPLPSQLPPQLFYQLVKIWFVIRDLCRTGGSHVGAEFSNQIGSSMQVERGSSWMPGPPDSSKMALLPGPLPLVRGQMGPGDQANRSAQLTPDVEMALLQQVMSLTPEQINLLPPEQRNQVLQLQQMLRQ